MTTPKIRIATVYSRERFAPFCPCKMSTLRWLRMSQALARRGYAVDMVMDAEQPTGTTAAADGDVRRVPFSAVDWRRYDVVKTFFHKGFDSLARDGADEHPFIISKLGSVVGPTDEAPGVYFFGAEREQLHATQLRIARRSRFVTVLTAPSRALWEATARSALSGRSGPAVLQVPTGVDRIVPSPARNPYAGLGNRIAVYVGNLYVETQREMNLAWQARLNSLGARVRARGVRLCFVGPGRVDRLDPACVTAFGPVHHARIWDYQFFASVGVALAQGEVQHNESSKIYYYLRAGLPVVAERPIPNHDLVERTGLGYVVAFGDDAELAERIEAAARREWPREEAIAHLLAHHTWDHRAAVYDEVIRRELGVEVPATAPAAAFA